MIPHVKKGSFPQSKRRLGLHFSFVNRYVKTGRDRFTQSGSWPTGGTTFAGNLKDSYLSC
jgi:hypothetical protein